MAASGQSRARAGLQRHRQRRRCYSGEVLHQFDLFIGERTDLLAEDGDSTDQFTLLEHRYKEVGSRASGFHEGDEAGVALDIALLRHQVDNVDNAPGCREAGEWVTRIVIDDKDRVPTPSLGVGARRVRRNAAVRRRSARIHESPRAPRARAPPAALEAPRPAAPLRRPPGASAGASPRREGSASRRPTGFGNNSYELSLMAACHLLVGESTFLI